MARLLGHRQTKGTETDKPNLMLPRHISTLPMVTQIEGLIGANGILPLQEQLAQIAQALPHDKYRYFPALFWFDASNMALKGVCFGGIAAACLVTFNIFTRAALIACFVCYLSITTAGQDFTSFQWDTFLLKSGILAILLTWNSPIILFLYRLLIARFMFMSGVVKIASGDPTWANLTALNYHYLTQSLPSPLAYYAYFLPEWWYKLCVSGVLRIPVKVATQSTGKLPPKPVKAATPSERSDAGGLFLLYFVSCRQICLLFS